MKSMFVLALGSIMLTGPCMARGEEATEKPLVALRSARLLDVQAGRMVSPALVVVNGTKIESINPHDLPKAAQLVDLGDVTMLPGLIDVHVHWNGAQDLSHSEAKALTPVQRAVRATRAASDTLLSGFTTVRILGSQDFIEFAIDRAAKEDLLQAPRVFGAGYQIYSSTTEDGAGAYKVGSANGVTEVTKAVRYMVKNGAQWIKVRATPMGATPIPRADAITYSPAELEAIVAEANRQKVKVAVHAHGPSGAHEAVMAGVHSVEHGSLVREDTLREMAKRGTWLVPTVGAVPAFKKPGGTYESMSPEIQAAEDNLLASQLRILPVAHELGVKLAFGSDIPGNAPMEFAMLLKVGLSNIEAIRTATVNAADLLGVDDRGQLAPGKLADIIAVAGDPLRDISVLGQVDFVMKGGKIFKRPELH